MLKLEIILWNLLCKVLEALSQEYLKRLLLAGATQVKKWLVSAWNSRTRKTVGPFNPPERRSAGRRIDIKSIITPVEPQDYIIEVHVGY